MNPQVPDDPQVTAAAAHAGFGAHAAIGQRIGRYRILALIGQGGMGAVYLAEQQHPNRQVALKLIRPGVASLQLLKRFALEAEALGRLQHPGIAQIYEAGTHDEGEGAQPYFAMEYIRGQPLDLYVRGHAIGTRARLELAAKVCDAVQHAHTKGLIHRDLKPGNILVTDEGQPKILDFGVARATDSDIKTTTLQTDIGQLIGTVPYMSPEQITGDPHELDTRSDVYALGVMIYEMLTGKLPYNLERKMIHEAARVIREQEPTRLSSVDRVFRGDVDTIVSKALEKEKSRRYQSANALAADIRRYLTDEPISARPPSTWYQFNKFAKRNKALVTAAGIVFAGLLVGASVATWQAFRATAAEKQVKIDRDAARIQAARAEQTAAFIKNVFEGIEPGVARGRDTTLLRTILDQSAQRVDRELNGQPEVEASIRHTLGTAYNRIAQYDQADAQLQRAALLQVSQLGENDPQTLSTRVEQARLLINRGKHPEAEAILRKALAAQRELLGPDAEDTIETSYQLGMTLSRQGRQQEGEQILRDTLNRSQRVLGDDADRTLSCMGSLAVTLYMQEKTDEAEPLLRKALETRLRLQGPDSLGVFIVQSNLASVLRDQGKIDEAEKLNLSSLEGAKRMYGPEHPETLKQMNNVGAFYQGVGRYADAERVHRQVLEIRARTLGPEHSETLYSLNNLAEAVFHQGRVQEAEQMTRKALEARQRTLGPDHHDTQMSLMTLSHILNAQRRFKEGADAYGLAVRGMRQNLSEADPGLMLATYNWAALLQNAGDEAGAEPAYREVLRLYEKGGKVDRDFMAAAFNGLAKSLKAEGKFDEAEPMFKDGLAMRERLYGRRHLETQYSLHDYGSSLVDVGRAADAEPLLRDSVSIMDELGANNLPRRSEARDSLGYCLFKQEKFEEAERVLLEARQLAIDPKTAESRPDVEERSVTRLMELYEAWITAAPTAGKDAELAKWKQAKADFDAAHPPEPEPQTQPASAPASQP